MSGDPTGQSEQSDSQRDGQHDGHGGGLDGERAYLLSEGTKYVTGWMQANDATRVLRDAFTAVGLDDVAELVRAEVNVFGIGLVDLGALPADTAAWIAYHLRALAHDSDRSPRSGLAGGRDVA